MHYDDTLQAYASWYVWNTVNEMEHDSINEFLSDDMKKGVATEFIEDTEEMLASFGFHTNLDWAHNAL